jgi:hypothetical protein
MNEYSFETREFGTSETGIHLLRSRFNYETIPFIEIERLTIEKGKELTNWLVVLVFGQGLVISSLYYALRIFNVIGNSEVNVIYIEEIIVPLIPLMVGGYCIYSSLRTGTVLRMKTTKGKNDKFPLRELEAQNLLMQFRELIKNKLGTKVRINI